MGTVYTQLSITERRKIERWRHAKVPVDEMARVLNRCRSTIFRELKRNHFSDESMPKHDGYYGAATQLMTADRRARDRKLIRHPALSKRVIDLLKNGWTPEQIGNRMNFEGANPRVCQETIYRYIYSKQGQRHDLWWYLPTHRVARRPRRTRRRREPKFHRDVSILFRPDDVAHRRQFGHWEGDLMIFERAQGNANVATLIERKTRYTLLLRNNDRKSRPLMNKLINEMSPLPADARRSVTFDRGFEFTSWRELHKGMGPKSWFCDPQAPWQKGSVENMNKRVRRYLPRDTDLLSLPNRYMKSICDRLNATPRKCLGYRTPAEAFRDELMKLEQR